MDRLPLEIRHMIAKWAGEDDSKKSLQALSQVNRDWNRIAGSILYQHLVIRLGDLKTHEKLFNLSTAQDVLAQVRRLSIIAEWLPYGQLYIDSSRSPQARKIHEKWSRIPRVLEGVPFGERPIPRVGGYAKTGWTRIVNVIRQLPYLSDVNIFFQNGGPVELFEALSQYHPTCRVSVFTACPFSQMDSTHIDFLETWADSPMLYAVHITYFGTPSSNSRKPIEHPYRLLQSIALRAPNIRDIAIQIVTTLGHLPVLNERTQVKSEAKSEEPPRSAKLETISWPLHSKLTVEHFQEWRMITDFGLLKSWTVGYIEDSTLLRTIVDILPFKQLTRLTLALFQPMDDLGFWGAAESMFQSLPPLSYLCLLGTYAPKFLNGPVLCRHGPTLRELKLQKGSHEWASQDLRKLSHKGQVGPIFSTDDILELAGHCPYLQKLLICVQRYQGLETDMWTSLGRFPCLEELDLVLNCLPQMDSNNMPVPPRELSDFEKSLIDNECPNWFIQDCMINCAISENLAKAFFMHILECQNVKHLVQLVIHPLLGQFNQYSSSAFRAIGAMDKRFLNELALTWTVKQGFLTGLDATSEKQRS